MPANAAANAGCWWVQLVVSNNGAGVVANLGQLLLLAMLQRRTTRVDDGSTTSGLTRAGRSEVAQAMAPVQLPVQASGELAKVLSTLWRFVRKKKERLIKDEALIK